MAGSTASDATVLVLGPVEARRDGRRIDLGGPKQRLVLALLVASAGTRVSVDRLIDAVWGPEPADRSRRTVQTYVSNLRSALGDVIRREGDGYVLAVERRLIDASRFEDELSAARALVGVDASTAAKLLRRALELWRGHPYADIDDRGDLETEIARLEELRLAALEARIDADLAAGHQVDLVVELEAIVSEHPLREEFRRQQMLALYRAGRQADALRVYHRTREVLADELGIDPSPRLRDMERRILNQDPGLDVEPRTEFRAFLFVVLEDSAALWETHPARLAASEPLFIEAVVESVADHDGRVIQRSGERLTASFTTIREAVAAAEAAQRALAATPWGDSPPMRAQMAVDAGEVEVRGLDFSGPTLARAERIVESGHGGQILLSAQAHRALVDEPDGRWQVRALGDVAFRGLGRPQRVYQLILDGLPSDFPELRLDRASKPLPGAQFDRVVRGYELRERIGGGDFGIVYRAYQASVGREVAVKCIRPQYANQPAFIRAFESEARLVAGLEHPHIVSLYDFWRDPDGAYLVMRWVRGGSLRRALERGPWNLRSALRLLDQVGSALALAHRHGVVHRDLKPANILLDEDGNAYLSDFGIATRLTDSSDVRIPLTSSPAYVAPEEATGARLTARADVYSLGLLTFELLTGVHPPSETPVPSIHELRPEIPAALDAVIGRAVSVSPGLRFDSAHDLVAAVHAAVGDVEPAPQVDQQTGPIRNPYKGLRAFGEIDAADFFGRDEVVERLLGAITERRLVAVVGPSGIGKSSVVHAGLLPALRRNPVTANWLVVSMYPGSHPFDELHAGLLRVASARSPDLMDELLADERGTLRATKRILPADTELVVVIDQFEEVFTAGRDERVRHAFLASLAALATDVRSRVRIVITLRADQFDRPLVHPGFGELLGDATLPLAMPSSAEFAEAVAAPARGVGVRLEDGLVDRIVRDVAGQPGGLPLLQHALTELFAHRKSALLTVHGYEAIGGVVGALGQRAEQTYERLAADRREVARRVFVRLVSIGKGGTDTRRRVRRTELIGLGRPRSVEEVLQRFGEHRLLTFDADPVSRTPTVEVAHEALIAAWPRLQTWLLDDRDGLELHRSLTEAAAEWRRGSDDEALLFRGSRLTRAAEWGQVHRADLNGDEVAFLEASHALVRREADDREAGAQRQLEAVRRVAEVERARAEDAVRSHRRLARRARVLAAAVVVAAVATGAALWFASVAARAEAISRAREIAGVAVGEIDRDPERALLLALEATSRSRAIDGTVLPEVEGALHRTIQGSAVVAAVPDAHQGGTFSVAVSPSGHLVVTGGRDGMIVAWRLEAGRLERLFTTRGSGEELERQPYGPSTVAGVAFEPAGRLFATAGVDGTVRLFDSSAGTQKLVLRGHRHAVADVAFGPPGSGLLATASFDGTARIWRVATGAAIASFEHGEDWVLSAQLGPNGRTLLTYSASGVARLWAAAERREIGRWGPYGRGPGNATFSPDGTRIAIGGEDALVHVIEVSSGREIQTIVGHANSVQRVAYDPTGGRMLTAGRDGTVRVWDAAAGATVATLFGHTGAVDGAAFAAGGRSIVSAGADGSVRLWDAIGGREVTAWGTPRAAGAGPLGQALAGLAGHLVGVRSERPGRIRLELWDPQSGDPGGALVSAHDLIVGPYEELTTALSHDGRSLAVWEQDGGEARFSVHDLATGRWVEMDDAPGEPVYWLRFGDDDRLLAAAGRSTRVRVWDTATGRLMAGQVAEPFDVNAAAFNPDGRMLATGTSVEGIVRIRSLPTGDLIRELEPHHASIADVRFSPDGRFVASSAFDGRVFVWDTTAWRRRIIEPGGGPAIAVAMDSAGRLAAASGDGTVTTWDLTAEPARHHLVIDIASGLGSGPTNVELSPDGSRLYVSGIDGAVRAYLLDVEELVELARARVTRELTTDECRAFLHVDACAPAP